MGSISFLLQGSNNVAFTAEELEQVEEYIFRQLPKVLAQDPGFVTLVEGIVAEKFPRRDEFARLLDELTATRQEQHEGFRELNTGFRQLNGRVAVLEDDVGVMKSDIGVLKEGQGELRAGQGELRQNVQGLKAGQGDLRAGQDVLRHDVQGLKAGQDELRHDVHGLKAGQDELRQDVHGLQAGQKRLEVGLVDLGNVLRREFNDAVARLGQRWGVMTEDVLRQVVQAVVQDSFGGKVREMNIAGQQFDIVVTNGEHILIEVTARASQKIIRRLEEKRQLYTKHTGVEPARVIVATAQIHHRVVQKLNELGIEVLQPDVESLVEEDEA